MGAVSLEQFFQKEKLPAQNMVRFGRAPALENSRMVDFNKKENQCVVAFAWPMAKHWNSLGFIVKACLKDYIG
jgi:hypothetical protein